MEDNRLDAGLYFDVSVEWADEDNHDKGVDVSIACDDPQTFHEGKVATPDQTLPWLVTRIQKLIHHKLGK